MQYRYEIEHASANFALRGEGTEKIKGARSDGVWVCNRGTLPLTSPLRREGLYSLIQYAQKQYRYEIEHAPANFALQRY